MKNLFVTVVSILLASCGGSSTPPCSVTGNWTMTDVRGASNGSCASVVPANATSSVSIVSNAGRLTWDEGAGQFNATLDAAFCNVNVVEQASQQSTLPDGTPFTITVSISRSIHFDGTNGDGSSSFNASVSVPALGFPCTSSIATHLQMR
jgi:hypothetical protein